jgi:hypothetical protein
MSTKIPICPKRFECKKCQLTTNNKKDYNKHLLTSKHNFQQNSTENPQIVTENPHTVEKKYNCICGNQYKERSGLWKHKKKCDIITNIEKEYQNEDLGIISENMLQKQIDTNLIIEILKQNQELQKTILELSKERTVMTNCNNNNKTFNLQVFLNEQCKDALNISEFVEQIKIQLTDLETTGRLGYVEGVTRIINKNLNELETNKRPIHCSDIKRETIYIKDENEWIKENNDKSILKNAVKEIANKNILQIKEWKKANPDCMDSDSKKNDLYLKIVSNSMSGSTKEEQINNLNKIISKVTKEAVIDKV